MEEITFKKVSGGLNKVFPNTDDIGIIFRVLNKTTDEKIDELIQESISFHRLEYMRLKTKSIYHKKYSKYKDVTFTMSI